MPISNIYHNTCHNTVELGIWDVSHLTTTIQPIYLSAADWLCVYRKLPAGTDATIVISACNHRQRRKSKWRNPSWPHFFCCDCYIVKANNGCEARERKSKIQMHPGRIVWVIWAIRIDNLLVRFLRHDHNATATIVRCPPCIWELMSY